MEKSWTSGGMATDNKLLLLGLGLGAGLLAHHAFALFRKKVLRNKWKEHVDDDQIQICLYSTENINSLGRVEKRTLYISSITEFFSDNQIVIEKLVSASIKACEESPFVAQFLSQEDRWHIMNICMNRISALFGPYHVFFNESRRVKTCFRSAWYLYTISSQQNVHRGRFFITPYKPVLSRVDRGVKRLRVELVNEQEMREIASGGIKPPEFGFFNNRHKQRWDLLMKMSELFENQLVIIENCGDGGDDSAGDESPRTESSWQPIKCADSSYSDQPNRTWSPTKQDFSLTRHVSNPAEMARQARRNACKLARNQSRDLDNCIMRVHIPIQSSGETEETSTKDVVLFE